MSGMVLGGIAASLLECIKCLKFTKFLNVLLLVSSTDGLGYSLVIFCQERLLIILHYSTKGISFLECGRSLSLSASSYSAFSVLK